MTEHNCDTALSVIILHVVILSVQFLLLCSVVMLIVITLNGVALFSRVRAARAILIGMCYQMYP